MNKKMLVCFSLVCAALYLVGAVFAAGGGGGGSGSSGLGFISRDSIFILVNGEYSEKFSLKNNTKYKLKIAAVNESVNVSFGIYKLLLNMGDNYLDLNGNGLADMNFRLESVKGRIASLRIIDAKEQNKAIVAAKESKKEERIDAKEAEDSGVELKCGNYPSLKERIVCRLGLEEDEQEEELELYYLPEECSTLSGAARGICIARYKTVQTCWKFPIGEERVSCAKKAIKLGSIQEEKEKCDKLTGENKSICAGEIKNKSYNLIKWKFYDLEERAEDFLKRGIINEDSAIDFIAKTEQNKMIFNEAKTKEERKEIILDVRQDWKALVDKIKEDLHKK